MMQTILIAEHAATHRDLLVHCLKDDYTVVIAADGATAVELIVACRSAPPCGHIRSSRV